MAWLAASRHQDFTVLTEFQNVGYAWLKHQTANFLFRVCVKQPHVLVTTSSSQWGPGTRRKPKYSHWSGRGGDRDIWQIDGHCRWPFRL